MRNIDQARFFILALLSAALAMPAVGQVGKPAFADFDAPGAGKTWSPVCANAFLGFLGCGTTPLANNDWGVVVGVYSDTNVVLHGFLRTPEGHITPLDAPGAGLKPGQGTASYAINDLGVVAGSFQDSDNIFHGFLRYPDGHFVTIDAPGAGTGPQQGTLATNVNLEGTRLEATSTPTVSTTASSGRSATSSHGSIRMGLFSPTRARKRVSARIAQSLGSIQTQITPLTASCARQTGISPLSTLLVREPATGLAPSLRASTRRE